MVCYGIFWSGQLRVCLGDHFRVGVILGAVRACEQAKL